MMGSVCSGASGAVNTVWKLVSVSSSSAAKSTGETAGVFSLSLLAGDARSFPISTRPMRGEGAGDFWLPFFSTTFLPSVRRASCDLWTASAQS